MLTRDDLKVIAVATVGIALLGGIAAHELGNRPEVDHYEIVEIARSAVPESGTEKEDAAEDCVYISTPSSSSVVQCSAAAIFRTVSVLGSDCPSSHAETFAWLTPTISASCTCVRPTRRRISFSFSKCFAPFSVFPSRGWHGSRFDLVVGFDGV